MVTSPKRSLSQNFLSDPRILGRIADLEDSVTRPQPERSYRLLHGLEDRAEGIEERAGLACWEGAGAPVPFTDPEKGEDAEKHSECRPRGEHRYDDGMKESHVEQRYAIVAPRWIWSRMRFSQSGGRRVSDPPNRLD